MAGIRKAAGSFSLSNDMPVVRLGHISMQQISNRLLYSSSKYIALSSLYANTSVCSQKRHVSVAWRIATEICKIT